MYYFFAFLIFWALEVVSTAEEDAIVRCGTPEPPAELLELAKSSASKGAAVEANRTIEIGVYIHVVESEERAGTVTTRMIDKQIEVLNEDYKPHGISFDFVGIDYTLHNDWSSGHYEMEMKSALRHGTYADLNLYYLSDFFEVFSLLGYCNFPYTMTEEILTADGCTMTSGTLPEGDSLLYNEGGTTTHEVGHWFGLFHVFESMSCSGEGDFIPDTPQQRVATSGCPTTQDSCEDIAGLDNVHNPMDYSSDACYETFTEGQKIQMFQYWDDYRAAYKE